MEKSVKASVTDYSNAREFCADWFGKMTQQEYRALPNEAKVLLFEKLVDFAKSDAWRDGSMVYGDWVAIAARESDMTYNWLIRDAYYMYSTGTSYVPSPGVVISLTEKLNAIDAMWKTAAQEVTSYDLNRVRNAPSELFTNHLLLIPQNENYTSAQWFRLFSDTKGLWKDNERYIALLHAFDRYDGPSVVPSIWNEVLPSIEEFFEKYPAKLDQQATAILAEGRQQVESFRKGGTGMSTTAFNAEAAIQNMVERQRAALGGYSL